MRPFDTSAAAHEFQIDGYRRMSIAQKADLVAGLSESARSVAREGIRQRHPDYDEHDVEVALVTLLYGRDVALHLWPNDRPRQP
jgi:hypothetical protein